MGTYYNRLGGVQLTTLKEDPGEVRGCEGGTLVIVLSSKLVRCSSVGLRLRKSAGLELRRRAPWPPGIGADVASAGCIGEHAAGEIAGSVGLVRDDQRKPARFAGP